ncbi:TonB-dependent receptor [Aureibacter tunicatorum]|nr:TonB-dependent receptor [Aureibacter tunicatorum]
MSFVFALRGLAENRVSIRGNVFDVHSKRPIPFSNISIEGEPIGTISDDKGFFELSIPKEFSLPFTLSVNSMGYKTKTVVVKSSQESLRIGLEEDIMELQEVVVNGDPEIQAIREKGFSVNLITTRQLEKQSVQVNELLDETPGIRVRQSGGLGSGTSFNINGLTGDAVRFFMDGVPMDFFGSSFSVNNIPVSMIERMEVYKGVVPVELGNDALGGAVNLVTKKNSGNALDFSYSFGSFNTHQSSLTGQVKDEKTGLTLRGSLMYSYSDNNYQVWGDDIYVTNPDFTIDRGMKVERFHDSFRSYGAKVDLGVTDKKWADQFFISILASNLDKDVQHGATMVIPYGERRYEQKTFMPNLSYAKDDLLVDGLNVKLFSAISKETFHLVDTSSNKYNWYGQIDGQRNSGEAGAKTLLTNEFLSYLNRTNVTYQLSENYKIGVNHVFSSLIKTGDDPLASPDQRTLEDRQRTNKHILGLTLENKSFNEKLKTSIFTKYYVYDVDVDDSEYSSDLGEYVPVRFDTVGSHLGYGLATSYSFNSKVSLVFSFENAARLPGPNELFGNASRNMEASYHLKPEKSNNYNLGVNFMDIGPSILHRFDIQTNLFYRDTRDRFFKTTSRTTQAEFFRFENIGKVISMGVDFDVKYHYADVFDFSFAMSYLDSRDQTPVDANGNHNLFYNERIPNEPYFQINNRAAYHFKNVFTRGSRMTVHWRMGYVKEFYRFIEAGGSDGKDMVPDQLYHDFGVNYSFPKNKVSLAFDLKNITNAQLFDNFALQKPGRAFYLKLNYRIF